MEQQHERAAADEPQKIAPETQPEAYTLSVKSPDEVATIISAPLLARPSRPSYELTKTVFVVGFMVAGKTSTSRRLARNCGVASVDLDAYIERREGKAINQIFAEQGQDAFRDMETDVLREFAQKDPLLVSCGGGVVLRPENRAILKENGFVVYLQVTAEQAFARIGDVSTRPNFRDLPTARKTIADRVPMYEEVASVSINTVGKSIGTVANEIQDILEKEGILCPRQK